jgi:hypothetical protein
VDLHLHPTGWGQCLERRSRFVYQILWTTRSGRMSALHLKLACLGRQVERINERNFQKDGRDIMIAIGTTTMDGKPKVDLCWR